MQIFSILFNIQFFEGNFSLFHREFFFYPLSFFVILEILKKYLLYFFEKFFIFILFENIFLNNRLNFYGKKKLSHFLFLFIIFIRY